MSKRRPGRTAPGAEAAKTAQRGPTLAPGERLRPWLLGAACALFVARPLYPSESAVLFGDGLPVVMLWIALAVFWLLGAVGHEKFRLRFGWLDAVVVLFFGLYSLSAIWAVYHGSPRPAINAMWEWLGLGLSFLLARQLIVGQREGRAVAAVMVGLAVALAGFGLYQYFYEMPMTQARYEADPEGMLREAQQHYAPGSRERELFENRVKSVEPMSTFALTNSLAGYLAPWLIVALGIGVAGLGWRGTGEGSGLSRKRLWGGIAGAAVPVGLCLLLTKSRSGLLASLVGLVLLGLLWVKGRARISGKALAIAGAVLAVLVGVAIASKGLDVEVLSEAGKSLGYRLQYWQSSLAMIADRPWLGCGPGNFQDSYLAYKLPEASEEIADPHNFLIEIWATAGTPALLAFLAILAGSLGLILRNSRLRVSPEPTADPVPAPSPTLDDPRYVYAGAALGFVLAFPLGTLSAASPGLVSLVLGLPLAAATVAVLRPWVDQGEFPPMLPAIGAIVLLVNLCAAGGIGLAGVAGSLWLLLALGLNAANSAGHRELTRGQTLGVLLAAVGLAVACYLTAYSPVLTSQAAMRLAQSDPAHAEEHLREAAEADPWAAEPRTHLAGQALTRWLQSGSAEDLRRFEQNAQAAVALAPRSAHTYAYLGGLWFRAFEKTRKPECLTAAVAAYRRTTEIYPNDANYQALLAISLRMEGDGQGFEEHRDRALWLDEVTPHEDRKLDRELRKSLQRSSSGPT